MASKELSIIIKAYDQASAPTRQAVQAILTLGNTTEKVAEKSGTALGGLFRHLTSVQGILQVFVTGALVRRAFAGFDEAQQALNSAGDMTRRLEMSLDTYKHLRAIAADAGVDVESLGAAFGKAQGNIGEFARTGRGPAADALTRMRIPLRDAEGRVRSIVELLPELAIQLERLPDNAARFDVLGGLFGGADDQLLQVLNIGPERLLRLRELAQVQVDIFTPEQIALAREYRLAVFEVREAWLAVKIQLFEEVSPFLIDFLKLVAQGLRAIPEVAGNVFGLISDAFFGGDGDQEEARAKVNELFVALGEIVKQGVMGIGAVATVTGSLVIRSMAASLGPQLKVGVATTLTDAVFDGIQEVNDAIDDALPALGLGGFLRSQLVIRDEDLKTGRNAVKTMVEQTLAGSSALQIYEAQISDTSAVASDLSRSWENLKTGVGDATLAFVKTTDGVFGISVALEHARVKADEFGASVDALRAKTAEPLIVDPEDFWGGFKKGAVDLFNEQARLYDQGRQVYLSTANIISTNLSTALVDAASRTKDLEEAFREFGANTLRSIAQVITQMLVLRAVAGIGQAFLGGAGGGAAAPVVGGTETIGRTVYGGLFVNSGGYIGQYGELQRFAAGGLVPGPGVNRDIVPALLTPGEGVVNRNGMKSLGLAGLQYLNRGGAAGGVAAGMSIIVNLVVNVAGGGTGAGGAVDPRMLAAIKRASADGVAEALEQRPSLRDRFRKSLGS